MSVKLAQPVGAFVGGWGMKFEFFRFFSSNGKNG
jgi:hypothetical protein